MKRHAFSLVELLVVVGIITLLLAILVPALGAARDNAKRVACLSNLKQLGISLTVYTGEWEGSFPYHDFWYNQSGQKGNLAAVNIAPFAPVDQTGVTADAPILVERPLNAYLNERAAVSVCPNDLGDAKKATVNSCFLAYGTSFQTQWNDGTGALGTASSPVPPVFGVVPVTGYATLSPPTLGRTLQPTLGRAAKFGSDFYFGGLTYSGNWADKIVLGDFNWQGNRPITDPRVLWHHPNFRNRRQQNMAFADGHAEFFLFPTTYGSATLPVNEGANGFW